MQQSSDIFNNQENNLNYNYENQSDYGIGLNKISNNPSLNSFYSHKAIRGNHNLNLNDKHNHNHNHPNELLNKSVNIDLIRLDSE